MTQREQRIALTRRLLDDGRYSHAEISGLVGRSSRWVKSIARQYPRERKIRIAYAPPEKPNVAQQVRVTRKAPAKRRKGCLKEVRSVLELTGTVALLILYALAGIRELRNSRSRLGELPEEGPVP